MKRLIPDRERKLQAFQISKTISRGGGADVMFIWRLKGRHAPEIERANQGWSRPFPTYADASHAAMKALGIDLDEKES